MNGHPCEKEQEVLEAAQSGRLAGRWGEDLRLHVASCASCADLVLVAESLQRENELVAAQVRVPSASLVWRRAQLRARREAAQQALAPVNIADKVALACALLGLIAAWTWEWPYLQAWFSRAAEFTSAANYELQGFLPSLFNLQSTLAMASGTAFLCLMVFVLYAALAKE